MQPFHNVDRSGIHLPQTDSGGSRYKYKRTVTHLSTTSGFLTIRLVHSNWVLYWSDRHLPSKGWLTNYVRVEVRCIKSRSLMKIYTSICWGHCTMCSYAWLSFGKTPFSILTGKLYWSSSYWNQPMPIYSRQCQVQQLLIFPSAFWIFWGSGHETQYGYKLAG